MSFIQIFYRAKNAVQDVEKRNSSQKHVNKLCKQLSNFYSCKFNKEHSQNIKAFVACWQVVTQFYRSGTRILSVSSHIILFFLYSFRHLKDTIIILFFCYFFLLIFQYYLSFVIKLPLLAHFILSKFLHQFEVKKSIHNSINFVAKLLMEWYETEHLFSKDFDAVNWTKDWFKEKMIYFLHYEIEWDCFWYFCAKGIWRMHKHDLQSLESLQVLTENWIIF